MARASDDTTVHLATPTSRAGGVPLVLRAFGEDGASTHPLPLSGSLVVGRADDAQVCLSDRSLSRRHAVIHVGDEQGQLAIEDLRSSNGVKVAGRLLDPGERVGIAPGTPIELGTVVLVVQRLVDAEADEPSVKAPPIGDVHRKSKSVAVSAAMHELDEHATRVAASNLSVLIRGETGVGKEVLAQTIHSRSKRASRPILCINCGAFTETLLDSELFGHEKGAFTGAMHAKPGLLESADGGTIFLDEVGEVPATLQVKLLRVLEEKVVRRVGALRSTKLDVRFISATNRRLEEMVAEGTFRGDLLYRLDGMTLNIPPLRDRQEEIEALARLFLDRFARAEGTSPKQLSEDAVASLRAYAWPGNVRELRNAVERAAVLTTGDVLDVAHLPRTKEASAVDRVGTTGVDLPSEIEALEKRRITEALDACGGSQTRAAKQLGIPRPKLMARMETYGIRRPRKR